MDWRTLQRRQVENRLVPLSAFIVAGADTVASLPEGHPEIAIYLSQMIPRRPDHVMHWCTLPVVG